MGKISKYIEFINESLILEAKIKYEKDFLDIINNIDSPIKTAIMSLQNTEVNVNQNYLDVVIDKEDTVSFLQDDRVEKVKYTFDSIDYHTYNYIHSLYDLPKFDTSNANLIKLNSLLGSDRTVDLIKFLNIDDKGSEHFGNLLRSGYNPGIVKIDIDGVDNYLIAYGLAKDISKIKRGEIKIGRFVRTLLKGAGLEFKDKDIEDFVTKYKSFMKIKRESFSRFSIVEKEEIRKWYLEDNYENTNGTLGGSCMRYSKCQDFLDVYTDNPGKVSMIILKSDKDDSKISGRAILWTVDDGRKVMDRIYTNNHADIEFFIQYANLNNYLYKFTQSYEPMPFVLNGIKLSNHDSSCTITLNLNHDKFPYMDTFKYISKSNDHLTNDYSKDYDYELTDTDGGDGSCESCGGSGNFPCEECDNGRVECWNCDGNGDVNCSDCDGDGDVSCGECDGEGNITCGICDGKGCEACDDKGAVACDACSGEGKVACDSCNSEGRVECDDCSGNGNSTCGCCDGDGRVDCYECN